MKTVEITECFRVQKSVFEDNPDEVMDAVRCELEHKRHWSKDNWVSVATIKIEVYDIDVLVASIDVSTGDEIEEKFSMLKKKGV